MWKRYYKKKKKIRTIPKSHAHLHIMMKTSVKFKKRLHEISGKSCIHKLTYYLQTLKEVEQKKKLPIISVKNEKIRVIPKVNAHLQTITNISIKLKKYWQKYVEGLAHTRYALSIHFNSTGAQKLMIHKKVGKNTLQICKVSKRLAYTSKRSYNNSTHKKPTVRGQNHA